MPYRKDPIFGFEVPLRCDGVPSEILDPASTWGSREEYDRKYDALAARFIDNFKTLAAGCPPEVVKAGPRRAGVGSQESGVGSRESVGRGAGTVWCGRLARPRSDLATSS